MDEPHSSLKCNVREPLRAELEGICRAATDKGEVSIGVCACMNQLTAVYRGTDRYTRRAGRDNEERKRPGKYHWRFKLVTVFGGRRRPSMHVKLALHGVAREPELGLPDGGDGRKGLFWQMHRQRTSKLGVEEGECGEKGKV